MSRSNECMEQQLIESDKHTERIGHRTEAMVPMKKKSDDKPTEKSMLFHLTAVSCWRKDPAAHDCFSNFFCDQCIEGHQREKASSDWSQLPPSEKTRIKNHHKKLKKIIKIMLCFSPRCPSPRPENADELVKWKRDVSNIACNTESG